MKISHFFSLCVSKGFGFKGVTIYDKMDNMQLYVLGVSGKKNIWGIGKGGKTGSQQIFIVMALSTPIHLLFILLGKLYLVKESK